MPKYSVIMSTYNRAAYLRQALDSVLGQTYRDFEMIVCEDGSTDNTQAILEGYGERIRTIRGLHKGMGAGLNAALALAEGEFVSILDSDDFWMPWTLEQVDKIVGTLVQPACVYLRPTNFMDNDVPRPDALPAPTAYRVFDFYAVAPLNVPNGSSMMGAMPRQVLVDAGGFGEWRHTCADHDFLLRVSRKVRYVSLDAPATVFMRQHAGRITFSAQKRFQGLSRVLDNQQRGMYGDGVDDALIARRVGRVGLSASLYMASSYGAWRESARLFRRTLRILPRRRVCALSVWYGVYLCAIMLSRLLEQFSRYCARRLTLPWSGQNRKPSSAEGAP